MALVWLRSWNPDRGHVGARDERSEAAVQHVGVKVAAGLVGEDEAEILVSVPADEPVFDPAVAVSLPPQQPVPAQFDRVAHVQRIGQTGGLTTVERYGAAQMRAIGKAGNAAAVKANGVAYVNGVLKVKRWDGPRRPEVLTDLAAGRVLADLDRAA